MSEELRPCPFCGSEARLPNNMDGTPVDYETPDCRCVNSDCPIVEIWMPIETWNTRPIEDALNKRIAELEAENEKMKKRVTELAWTDRPTVLFDLKARIAELEEERRWIPVGERLPDIGEMVKLYDVILEDETEVGIAFWDGWVEGWFAYDDDGDGYVPTMRVTHWRERPQLPEVQE